MLKIYKKVMRAFPCEVLELREYDAISNGGLQLLRCTCCQHELGNRPWGVAWIKDGENERSARLCWDCVKDAKKTK